MRCATKPDPRVHKENMAYGTVMHALALKCLTFFAHVWLSRDGLWVLNKVEGERRKERKEEGTKKENEGTKTLAQIKKYPKRKKCRNQ